MTVAELILRLQEMPQDAEVTISHDGEHGTTGASHVWLDGARQVVLA